MAKTGLLLTTFLVLVAGCVNPPGKPPVDRREALERVNSNLAKIGEPLQYSALVSFSFRDQNGRKHAFNMNEARLLYQPPQALLFDVRSLAGTVAQFGSNDAQYWVWVDVPELRKLWWGSWHRVTVGSEQKLPVPPNELLDALMLRPLSESLEGGQLPLLRISGEDQRLMFVRLSGGGQPVGGREIQLDPRPPYLPIEIVDRLPDGAVVMRAQLMNYERLGLNGPLTPRRYIVNWPQNDAEMRLDILGARFRPDLPRDVFEFPANWQGESDEIDARPEGTNRP